MARPHPRALCGQRQTVVAHLPRSAVYSKKITVKTAAALVSFRVGPKSSSFICLNDSNSSRIAFPASAPSSSSESSRTSRTVDDMRFNRSRDFTRPRFGGGTCASAGGVAVLTKRSPDVSLVAAPADPAGALPSNGLSSSFNRITVMNAKDRSGAPQSIGCSGGRHDFVLAQCCEAAVSAVCPRAGF